MKHLVDKTILVPFREELKYAVCIVSGWRFPAFRQGKHRVRLYTGRSFGALPRPQPLRRHKLHIICPAASGRAHSFRCVSSPNETRFAGLSFGWGESLKGVRMPREKKTEIITLRVTPPDKGRHPGACEKRKQNRHGLPVSLRSGQGDRAGGGSGQGASELRLRDGT